MVAQFREQARKRLNEESATETIRTLSAWQSRANERSGRAIASDRPGRRACDVVGLAQHLHLHQGAGRTTGGGRNRNRAQHRASRASSNRRRAYPFPGWNEGFTTTAPIIFMTLKGQHQIPANKKLILDITPVDQVAAVMLAVAAAGLRRRTAPRLSGGDR